MAARLRSGEEAADEEDGKHAPSHARQRERQGPPAKQRQIAHEDGIPPYGHAEHEEQEQDGGRDGTRHLRQPGDFAQAQAERDAHQHETNGDEHDYLGRKDCRAFCRKASIWS